MAATQARPPESSEVFPFVDMIPTPLEVLGLYDEDICTGVVKIHDWQKEVLRSLGKRRSAPDEAVRVMLLAANGSGKSQFILAPFAVWVCLAFTNSLTVVTTASGDQMDKQARRYITRLCTEVNRQHREHFGFDIFDCQVRRVTNVLTKSYIDMFATDDPGRAEGHHRLKHDGEFALIIDEAKTVADEIFKALAARCKDYTRRLDVTSPGDCSGYFYDTWTKESIPAIRKRVTAFDCPHISQRSIQETILEFGMNSPVVRSSIYSEFCSTQEQVVISRELLNRCIAIAEPKQWGELVGGLDLAAGGDETVLSVWYGNQEVGLHTFKNTDAIATADKIVELINLYKGRLKSENINADDGGLGRSVIDILCGEIGKGGKGLKIRRILNQHRAFDSTHYANRGTELWHNFKRFVEEYQVVFLKDSKGDMDHMLFTQLTNRYYKNQPTTGKLILEPKQEARKKGHQSPDRADAVVLAWAGRSYPLEELTGTKAAELVVESPLDRHERLSNELRAKLRDEVINGPTKSRNSNVTKDGTYKRTGSFSFALSNIIPRPTKYGTRFK